MTDITVFSQSAQVEDLSWDLTPPHGGWEINGVLDVTAFNPAQHYANGYLKSGIVLGRNTTTQLLGPYLGSASNGTQTAVGLLKASVSLVQPTGVAKAKVGCAVRVHAIISERQLPYTSSNAALGGYVDAAARTALRNIYFGA